MLSLEDLHAQIDELLSINSIESSYSYEFYTDLINSQRELWLRNEYNKNRSIDPYVIQTLKCIELELVNPIDCCFDVPSGCKILRSKKKIPNTIELFFTTGITSVGPADILKPRFSLRDYSQIAYIGYGRTTGKTIYAFLYDNYMYVISKDPSYLLLRRITIRGIFADPTSLGEFINCEEGGTCWSPSDPYPLNQWMWEYMKPQILNQLMQKASLPLDDSNNAEDGRTEGK
jgi:hypothetical protein